MEQLDRVGYLLNKLPVPAQVRKAFSLLELTVALIIMAIFSALAIPTLIGILNSNKTAHKALSTTTTIAKATHHGATHPASAMTTFDNALVPVGIGLMSLLVLVFIISLIAKAVVSPKKRLSHTSTNEDIAQSLRAAKSARVPSASQYATSGAMVTSMDTSSQAPDTLTPDTPVPIAHRPVGQITRKQQRDQRRLSAQPRFR